MPRPERVNPNRVMISYRVPKELLERFKEFAKWHTPRASDTELLERALVEFLDRNERKEKKR